jgi:plasmid stabilization system protein ParE
VGFRVVFTPEALTQLEAIEDYIARHAGDRVAGDFVDAIVERCSRLDLFPQRGVPRDDMRPGLRVLGFRDSSRNGIGIAGFAIFVFSFGMFTWFFFALFSSRARWPDPT